MVDAEFLNKMECAGIVPVIKLENTADAEMLAKALYEGGIRCAEVTFRADGAEKVIEDMVAAYPDMLVGAGTVLSTEQVDKAVAAGAKFCVAPGLNPKVVKHCLDKGVPFIPGVANGSQIEQALDMGLNFVKFFPAEQAGGLQYIKAVSAPYSNVYFMPTGGISENNIGTYLSYSKVVCCGGSWIVPDRLVKEKRWQEISVLCRSAVTKILDFRFAHMGINCGSDDIAKEYTQKLERAFGFTSKECSNSFFAGNALEYMKSVGRGKIGHIAVSTPNVMRAAYHLGLNGIEVDMTTAKYDSNGKMNFVYLKNGIGEFAVHLIAEK